MNKFMCATIGSAFALMAVVPNMAFANSFQGQTGWHNDNSHGNLRYGYRHAPYRGHRYKYGPYYGYWYYPYSYSYFPYGGLIGAYASDNYAADEGPVGTITVVPEPMVSPPPHLKCKHSEETKTVPAEGGGEKQIRITRC